MTARFFWEINEIRAVIDRAYNLHLPDIREGGARECRQHPESHADR
jgi:hypothetical protein